MLIRVKSVFRNFILLSQKVSLEKKLIFFNILLLAVPTVILGVILIQNVKKNIETDSFKSSQEALQRAKTNIERNVEICSNAMQMVTNNKNFMSFISEEQDYEVEDLLRFKTGALNNIQSIMNVNPDIYSIRFFSNNPFLFEMWGIIYDEKRIQEEPWYEEVLNRKDMYNWRFNQPYKEMASPVIRNVPEEAVSLSSSISYANNTYRGILDISMSSEIFFSDFYEAGNNDSSFMCMIKQGELVAFNKKSDFLSGLGWETADLLKELEARTKDDEGSFVVRHGGRNLTVVYSRIGRINSCLYRISSVDAMVKGLNTVRNYILLGIAAGILVLSLVTYLITSILLKKLRTIIDSMRKVQNGDLNVNIPVYGNDEMGELAYHYRKMMAKIQKLIHVVVQEQTAFKDAELKALHSQINKHFLYNVLESINMLAESHHEYEISDIVTSLGRLMRYSMSWNRQYVTLGEEIENTRNYISLVNARYDNIVKLELNVEESLYGIEVLKMLLQPIVENSVIHGFEQKGRRGCVKISAFIRNQVLVIEISDNGAGLESNCLAKLRRDIEPDFTDTGYNGGSTGIGLKNVNMRIRLFYGKEYGLEVDSMEDRYTRVTVNLPFNTVWEEGAVQHEGFNSR